MSDLYELSARSIANDFIGRREKVQRSLAALADQTGSYAHDHFRLVELFDRILHSIPERAKLPGTGNEI